LLQAGVDKDAAEACGGRTALHFAALRSNAAAAKALLDAGANKEARDSDARTPLHLSCMVRPLDPATPLCLIGAGAVSTSSDAHGVTPLDIAVRYGCAAVVRAIFFSPGPGTRAAPCPRPTPGNTGLLFEAVSSGNAGIVEVLVQGGWEVGVPTPTPSATAVGEAGEAASEAASEAAGEEAGARTLADKPVGAPERVLSPMMLAADGGRPEVVRALLRGRNKGYPNAGDSRGYTALHFATMRGSASIARALVDEGGADPDLGNLDGDTPLHIAVATRKVYVGEVLLRAGASVDAANRQGHTALHFAAALGLAGFTKQLLDRGADFGAVDGLGSAINLTPSGSGGTPNENCGKEKKARGLTAVTPNETCGNGKVGGITVVTPNEPPGKEKKVGGIITAVTLPGPGCSTRATNTKGAAVGSVRKSRRLELRGNKGKRGSSLEEAKKEGRTALHYAAMNGRAEAVRVLLHAGAAAGHRWNGKRESPLFVAARNGHAEVVGLLLERLGPGDVDVEDSSGETPLSVACTNGHAEVVDQLLREGADVSRRNPATDQSPLDNAITGKSAANRARVVRALLAANADPEGGDEGGGTGGVRPLHAACRAGERDVVEALLETWVDTDAAPRKGRRLLRPLHVAAVHGNAAVVEALTLKGCRLDVRTLDPSRSTPLVLAVQQGHVEAARALIEAGARIDIIPRGEDGTELAPSLARLAADMKRADMVALLVKAVVKRDSSESWTREWAATVGVGV
ncbi:unnamed protein product, partial [Laminaria digitata]